MTFQWPVIATVLSLCAIPLTISFLVLIDNYKKQRHQHLLYLMGLVLSMLMWCVFELLAAITLSPVLYIIAMYCFIFISLNVMLLMDAITRMSPDPKKIGVLLATSTFLVVVSFMPDSVTTYTFANGDITIMAKSPGLFQIAIAAVATPGGVLWVFHTIKIIQNSPRMLKLPAFLMFLGAFNNGIVAIAMYAINLHLIIPAIYLILVALGMLPFTYVNLRYPKLGFVIPSKSLRLVVMEVKSGIQLYTHTWTSGKDMVDADLFSGMIQGMNEIVKESIRRGGIRTLELAQAVISIEYSNKFPIACLLVATKPNKAMKLALQKFTAMFCEQFGKCLSDPSNITPFACASVLVSECFPFVPSSDG